MIRGTGDSMHTGTRPQRGVCEETESTSSHGSHPTPAVSSEIGPSSLRLAHSPISKAPNIFSSSMAQLQRPCGQGAILLLPDSALVHLFKLLAPAERQAVIPLVCRRFRALANIPSPLWEQVHLAFPADFQQTLSMAHLYQFFVRREGGVLSLHVEMSTAAAWPAVLAVLGVVGRGLQHLRVAGESSECQVPGCTAPWLELAPNLESLELDDVVDHSIAEARFPQGAASASRRGPPAPPVHRHVPAGRCRCLLLPAGAWDRAMHVPAPAKPATS